MIGVAAAVDVRADGLARIVDALLKSAERGTKGQGLVESDIAAAAVEEPVAAGLWTPKIKVHVGSRNLARIVDAPRVHGRSVRGAIERGVGAVAVKETVVICAIIPLSDDLAGVVDARYLCIADVVGIGIG